MPENIERRVSVVETKVSDLDKNIGIQNQMLISFNDNLDKLSQTIEKFDSVLDIFKSSIMEVQLEMRACNDTKLRVDKIEKAQNFNLIEWLTKTCIPYVLIAGITYFITTLN